MDAFHHGNSPSAEFPWMLVCPGKDAQYFRSYQVAEKAAEAYLDGSDRTPDQIVIAYALGTLMNDDNGMHVLSHRSRAIINMLVMREQQGQGECDPAWDISLENGSTAHAAGAYLTAATAWSVPRELRQVVMASAKEWWPWATDEWQPENSALGNLRKALALLLIEAERLERHRYVWQRVKSENLIS